MEAGGHNPHGVDHFAKAGTAAEKLQGDLWVGHLTKSREDPKGLGNTSLRVSVAELSASHRPAKQLEVTVPDDLEVGGEVGNINCRRRTTGEDEFAFVLADGVARLIRKSRT